MSKTSPAEFIRQVRQEVSRVTWGTRKETLRSTFMVLIMILIAAGFFWLVDLVIFNIIQVVLGY